MSRASRRAAGQPDVLSVLFDPTNVRYFIVGAVLVSVLGGAAFAAADAAVRALHDSVWASSLVIAIITAGILLALRPVLYRSVARSLEVVTTASVAPERLAEPHRALIVLVSRGPRPEELRRYAIQHHHRTTGDLQRLWLVHSPQTIEEAQATAAELRREEPAPQVTLHEVDDAESALAAYRAVGYLIDRLADREIALAREDLIVDITGGTKMMTAGAVLACVDRGVAMQYVRADYNPMGEAAGGLAAIKVEYLRGVPGAVADPPAPAPEPALAAAGGGG